MRRNLRLMGNLLPRQHHPLVDSTLLREASTLWLGSRNGGVTMSEKSDVKPPIETIPSVDRGISALASAHAPFLYFDRAPAFGHMNGIIRVTLEAYRDIPLLPNGVGNDRAIVAHLRMNIAAAHSLKAALERALLLAVPPPLQHHDDPSSKPNSPPNTLISQPRFISRQRSSSSRARMSAVILAAGSTSVVCAGSKHTVTPAVLRGTACMYSCIAVFHQ